MSFQRLDFHKQEAPTLVPDSPIPILAEKRKHWKLGMGQSGNKACQFKEPNSGKLLVHLPPLNKSLIFSPDRSFLTWYCNQQSELVFTRLWIWLWYYSMTHNHFIIIYTQCLEYNLCLKLMSKKINRCRISRLSSWSIFEGRQATPGWPTHYRNNTEIVVCSIHLDVWMHSIIQKQYLVAWFTVTGLLGQLLDDFTMPPSIPWRMRNKIAW